MVVKKLYPISSPRVLIIDDFSELDPVSMDVLQKYYEESNNPDYCKKGGDFWVILDTGKLTYENIKNWKGGDKFKRGKLLMGISKNLLFFFFTSSVSFFLITTAKFIVS